MYKFEKTYVCVCTYRRTIIKKDLNFLYPKTTVRMINDGRTCDGRESDARSLYALFQYIKTAADLNRCYIAQSVAYTIADRILVKRSMRSD